MNKAASTLDEIASPPHLLVLYSYGKLKGYLLLICTRHLWTDVQIAIRRAGFRREGVEVGGAERGGAVGVTPANILWSRPRKPGEIMGKVKGRLAVPAAELFRCTPTQVHKLFLK